MTLFSLIFLVVLLLAFARLSVWDTRGGIYAVIFLMPLYLIRFSIFGIPTTTLEVMIYILFVVWLLKNRKRLKISESVRKFYDSDKLLAAGITLLFFGVILSTLFSSDLLKSLGILKGWFFDPFLFFIIFTNEIRNQRQGTALLLSFILSGFAVALIAIVYALSGVVTFDGRLCAFYGSPNYLGMYFSPAFLFAAYLFIFQSEYLNDLFIKEKSIKEQQVNILSFRSEARNLYITKERHNMFSNLAKGFLAALFLVYNNKNAQAIILLSFIIVIFLTKSYGAILGITAALFCFLFKKYKKGNAKIFLENKKMLAVLATIAFVVFSFLTLQKYEQIINSSERSSLHSRFMIWNASLEILKDNPFFGIGPGTFQEVYLDYQSRFAVPYLEWAVPEPHNTFLAFYLQSGLIGVVGFILILLWLFKKARASDIVFLFLIYFLVHGLVDTLYWKNDLSLIFWLMVGIGLLSSRNK